MRLDPDELRLFYKLYPALLCFVNQRQGITSTPFTTPGRVRQTADRRAAQAP